MMSQVFRLALGLALIGASNASAAQPPVPQEATDSFLPRCPTSEELRAAIKPISAIRANMTVDPGLIRAEGLPLDCSQQVFLQRKAPTALYPMVTEFNWVPTNFFHQPLYFDDQPLERYGQSVAPHLQPIISGGRFFLTLPVIPYKIGRDRTHDRISTLAYQRAGGWVPCMREKVVPSLRVDAGLLQAGTIVALVFLLP